MLAYKVAGSIRITAARAGKSRSSSRRNGVSPAARHPVASRRYELEVGWVRSYTVSPPTVSFLKWAATQDAICDEPLPPPKLPLP